MAHRRSLIAIAVLAAILHGVVVARTLLPAQDGLKYIRVARLFQVQPWSVVIQDADVHPLYPALIALVEPVVASLSGPGPDAWRIAAQVVAAAFSVGLIFPVYFLTRALFDNRVAFMAAGIVALLPRAAEIGHDTLADSVGLFMTFLSLWLGARAVRTQSWRLAAGCGLTAGAGYLGRPEVILVAVAVGVAWIALRARDGWSAVVSRLPALCVLVVATALLPGYYAVVKGEISEKLAVRHGAMLGSNRILHRAVPQQLPQGLDDPRWDFSPKEETDRIPIQGWRIAVVRIAGKWWEQLCWFFAVMTVWGLVRKGYIRDSLPQRDPDDARGVEGTILLSYACVYSLALVRNSAVLGYLSGRHVMALVITSAPWAAAGAYVCGRGLARQFDLSTRATRWLSGAVMALTACASIVVQMQPNHVNHLSRWGHWAAGHWLAAHARPDELVLDTRGWGRFISGWPGYDYWHVRQALTDSHLKYVLVGLDELEAASPRADTLKALLAFAATPLHEFPAIPGDRSPAVRLYSFHLPSSWEGLAR
jgi:4-amino-4-deoxy-L-arabinose transferase-like glycosyltransferase